MPDETEKTNAGAETGGEETAVATTSAAPRRRKGKRNVHRGVANIRSTFNNTMVTICEPNGDVIAWKSGGTMNFKGSRKGTPFAAQRAAQDVAEQCKAKFGLREVDVKVQGPGPGRESAVRGLQSAGLDVKSIEDVTPLPHNGCRPRKKRRV